MNPLRTGLVALALLPAAAGAQDAPPPAPPEWVADPSSVLKEPVAWRVYQRDENGRATIPVTLADGVKESRITSASLDGASGSFRDGKLVGVPTGGPYTLNCTVKAGDRTKALQVGNLFVGDLWVLAGQSNMEGVGDLIDVTPPHDRVALLGMDGNWARAEEPLHWLVDSPDPVHHGDPASRKERSESQHRTRRKGAGLGLPFATALTNATNVPIGLVACAHGGTSMGQWDPARKDEGGKSLYGSMIRQVNLAGGKVKGVLWYQGESDASDQAAPGYPRAMDDLVAAVRKDFGQPDLPFYLVQIGRVIRGGDPKPWNAVQDAQRQIPDRIGNTAVAAVIDLELDDGIHVGTHGLKRLGQRLARVALRDLYGQAGATTPTLDRVHRGPNNTLVVKFRGVNRSAAGFGGMMAAGPGGGRGGMGGMGGGSIGGAPAVSGLQPERHIGGFSLRKEDGSEIPQIFEARVGPSRDTVILKLTGKVPSGARLWYGWGFDPYANLTDALDMAVPVFGPVSLDDVK